MATAHRPRQRRPRQLELAGIYTAAYLSAPVGGILLDPRLGMLPPVGLSDLRLLSFSVAAAKVKWLAGELMSWPVVMTR